jgi:hypothetical protein
MRGLLGFSLVLGLCAVASLSGCDQAGEQVSMEPETDCSATCAVAGAEAGYESLCEAAQTGTQKEAPCVTSAGVVLATCEGCPGSEAVAACAHSHDHDACVETCIGEDCTGNCPIHGQDFDQAASAHPEHVQASGSPGSLPACRGIEGSDGSVGSCPAALSGGCPLSSTSTDSEVTSR